MSRRDGDALRDTNRAVLTELLRRLGTQDFAGACSLLTKDVICDWPYPPTENGPSEIRGREAIQDFFTNGMSAFDPYRYRITNVFELVDAGRLIAEYESDSRLKATGAPYRNRYLGIFHFEEGLVAYWREYINPVVVARILASTQAPTSLGRAASPGLR